MDLSKKITAIYIIFSLFIYESVAITVQISSNPSAGILGQGGLELQCSYTVVTGELVTSIYIQAKINGEFKNIAAFFPVLVNKNATLSPAGNYLQSRVTLTNPTDVSLSATINYYQIECEDEKEYRCKVVYASAAGDPAYSDPVSITIKGSPAEPDLSPVYTPTAGIEEGNIINFTCTGNVGKPQGRFRWIKRFKDAQETIYDAETTTAVIMPGTCTFNGTSSLSLQMTDADNGIIVQCKVVYENIVQDLFRMTQRIEVYYSVRNAVITLPQDAPPSYAEGADPIIRTCAAEGNPLPEYKDYTWYKQSNMSVPLETGPMLNISNVIVNESDTYVCVVQNKFNGKIFNSSDSVSIQIVVSTTPAPTTTPPTSTDRPGTTRATPLTKDDAGLDTGAIAGIAIGVAIVVIIIIVIIIFMMKKRNLKEGSIDEPPEKPRNNLSFVDKPDALGDKNGPFNSQIHYADLTFEDRPRSRKPLQLSQDSDLDQTPYAQVMMPSV